MSCWIKKASFHKSCSVMYNKDKLERKRKSLQNIQKYNEEADSHTENLQPPFKRPNRQSKGSEFVCFICEKEDQGNNLHRVETFSRNNSVKVMALELEDRKLLEKLSQGDLIASEGKYHSKCMLELKNRYRSCCSMRNQAQNQESFIEGAAFSELIDSIADILLSSEKTPVFMMKDIRVQYQYILKKLGAADETVTRVNVTRLKEAILAEIPDLFEEKKGKYSILTSSAPLGDTIYEASRMSSRTEGATIHSAARIIRKYMFENDEVFNGDLSRQRQKKSVSQHLLLLVGSILEDTKDFEFSNSTKSLSLYLAQLIRFNSVKTRRKGDHFRHSKLNEPPLPVMIGLSIHSKTREKQVIDSLFSKGLCISYDRVISIEDNITKGLCKKYNEEGVVCPPGLQSDLFTCAAIDNIDHNPSSSTASNSYHGTSISIFQFPTMSIKSDCNKYSDEKIEKSPSLPESFTQILPAKEFKPEPTNRENRQVRNHELLAESILGGMEDWAQKLTTLEKSNHFGDKASFSGYFDSNSERSMPKTSSTLLPLINESINSTATVKHCMDLIHNIVQILNPSQKIIITADQPVYALGKQVQWMYPDRYTNVTWLMGPLHVEMSYMNAIGSWLSNSGWVEAFQRTKMSTTGKIESFLYGSKVKRCRYAHQVSLAALLKLAFKGFEAQDKYNVFDTWKEETSKKNSNVCYWFHVIDMEMLLFAFIKSLRSANFPDFLQSIRLIAKWMFLLDHVHYSRWLPVFINDLENLDQDTLEAFKSGYFTIKRSNRSFSNIAIDQAHEQNNKLVKIHGGAIGIFDNQNALLRWSVSTSVIASMCEEDVKNEMQDLKHHEDKDSYEVKFRNDVDSLYKSIDEMGNPFEETEKNLVNLSSKVILNETASQPVFLAQKLGEDLYNDFFKNRLHSEKKSFYDILPKNNIQLFKQSNLSVSSKEKQKINSLIADRKLFSRLFIACQSRVGSLEDFFSHENHSYPISISEYGKLRKCNGKSEFLKCLYDIFEPPVNPPQTQLKVIDGAALINMNPPRSSKVFEEYCDEIKCKVENMVSGEIRRIDLVFDVYKENSLKLQTRECRGHGTRLIVRGNTPVPKDFQNFLRNSNNKTELFNMLADKLMTSEGFDIVCTKMNDAVSVMEQDLSKLRLCNHEEADTRVILHLLDAANKGIKKATIVTVDTDIVVIALYHFFSLNMEELWIELCAGKYKRFLPIHTYAKLLNEETCRALPLWFTITGCDTVSMFAGRGKRTCWQAWKSFPSVTRVFINLLHSERLTDEDFSIIERFVVLLYDRSSTCISVNDCRRVLFTSKNRDVESIPPTKDALQQHLLRAMLQAIFWCRADQTEMPQMDPRSWGWLQNIDGFSPCWTTIQEASEACRELIRCGCKVSCQGRCKCKKSNLSCTELCACGGGCIE